MNNKNFQIIKLSEQENLEHFFHFDVVELSNKKSTIEVLRVGVVHDRGLKITPEMLEDYVRNFKEGVYGTEIQVNLGHNREGEAAGWVKSLFIQGDTLLAEVEWTPLGEEKINSKQYKFTSSELAPSFPDAKTGEKAKNVFIGVALTNVPAVKGMAPVSLSEKVISFNSNSMKKFADIHKKLMAKKGKITDEEFAEAKECMKDHEDKEEAKGMMAELKKKMADHEEPDGDEGKGGKGDGDGDEKKKVEKASENAETVNLAEFNKLSQQLAEEKAQRMALQEKIVRKELSERIENELSLSADRQIGFLSDEATTKEVADFLMSLSEDQREKFFELLSQKVRHVDLSVIGNMGARVVKKDLTEENVVELAETLLKEKKAANIVEAQKMAKLQLESGDDK